MSKVDTPRSISTVFNAKNRNNGGDSSVRIIIGGHAVRTLDPFLMYGHYTVPPPGGFPDHPHRGFETVGYMLEGNLEHEDFGGHRGIVHPGDVQWMTAGRGIMHSEMAVGDRDAVILHLWVNLPEKDRLCEPAYQEVKRDEMPRVYPLGRDGGAEVKIIAGKQFGVASSVTTRTLIIYLDVTLEAGKQIHHTIPASYNGVVYILQGRAQFGSNQVHGIAHDTLVLDHDGDTLKVTAAEDTNVRYVLVAGEPINEPIYQYGPFVMGNEEGILQSISDFRNFSNGFERGRGWESELAKRYNI